MKILILETIPKVSQGLKYFYIRSHDDHFLYETRQDSQVSVGSGPVSCRWPSLYSLFHWTGQYLVNGRGYFLGLEHEASCGPGFEEKKDQKPENPQ